MIFFAEEPTPGTQESQNEAAPAPTATVEPAVAVEPAPAVEPTPAAEPPPAAEPASAAPEAQGGAAATPATPPVLFATGEPAAAPEVGERATAAPEPDDQPEAAESESAAPGSELAAPAAAASPPKAPAVAPPAVVRPAPVPPPLRKQRAVIKVIGVGGAGGNAVNRMIEAGVTGVDFIAANTDAQVLELSKAPLKIQLGHARTDGLGCGGDPEVGRAAARDDMDRLIEALTGAQMVFIPVGEGGGTGTGASPVVACVAQELGALCIAVATKPMSVEGRRRKTTANEGVRELREFVDTLICIPNDRVVEVYGDLQIQEAFRAADDVVRQAVQGISDLIQIPGIINLDFRDVQSAMRAKGDAVMGIGIASGEDRVEKATEAAISSPLLEDTSIEGATSIIVNVTGGSSLTLLEAQRAARFVTEAVAPEGAGIQESAGMEPGDNVFWGAANDPALDERDEVRVTVVATGFPNRSRAGVTPHDFAQFRTRATGTDGARMPAVGPASGGTREAERSGPRAEGVGNAPRAVAPAPIARAAADVGPVAAVAAPPEVGAVSHAADSGAVGDDPLGAVAHEGALLSEDAGGERWGDLETPAYLLRRR